MSKGKDVKPTTVLAKANSTALAAPVVQESWDTGGVDQRDVLIPRILVMQPLSKLVSEELAKPGDVVRSTTGEVLANAFFIPIMTFKTWVEFEVVGGKGEFRGTKAMDASNVDWPLEFEAPGRDGKAARWTRDRVINFYVLLPGDLEREAAARREADAAGEFMDPDAMALPCALSFRRTGMKTGKELVTHFMKCDALKCPPAVKMFTLTTQKEKNDKGFYWVPKVEPIGKTTKEHTDIARRWFATLSAGKARIHEVDEEVVSASGPAAVPADTSESRY